MPSVDRPDESLSDRIYLQIRTKIINGELPPGTRLRERELAEELSVSRIPLREAMPQLEADGFIVSANRRGAVVTELTLRDVRELFDVRLGVEVFATRLAAQQVANGASTDNLRDALARADKELEGGDANAIAESNAEFHEEIVRLADNSLLTTMMNSFAGRYRWIFRMTSNRDEETSCHEHHELCAAICAGKPDFAAAISYFHIEGGREQTLDALRSVLPESESEEHRHDQTGPNTLHAAGTRSGR